MNEPFVSPTAGSRGEVNFAQPTYTLKRRLVKFRKQPPSPKLPSQNPYGCRSGRNSKVETANLRSSPLISETRSKKSLCGLRSDVVAMTFFHQRRLAQISGSKSVFELSPKCPADPPRGTASLVAADA